MAREWLGKHWLNGEAVSVKTENGIVTDISACSGTFDEWIAPGLIDLQVNGIAGSNLNGADVTVAKVGAVLAALHREGVTKFCPTIVTGTRDGILAGIRVIVDACGSDSRIQHAVLGIHIEGPFISPEDGPRGAHNADWVRRPDWTEFCEWQEAAGGRITTVTIAPEVAGAIDFISRLTASGVIASIGHSAATPEHVKSALAAGATMATHLGNGCHTTLDRHSNHIWSQLAEDRQWAGLIPDGFHLPPEVLKVMIRAKGRKAILTSDASYLAQMPAGRYRTHHGNQVILEPSGKLHLAGEENILAGSALTLRQGIENVANLGILPLGEAISLASLHPAELLGLAESGVGDLRVGGPADFITYRWDDEALTSDFVITGTISRGELVYSGK